MTEIDLTTWKRREHFDFFGSCDLPFYNINTRIEVTGLKAYAKAQGFSLTNVLMHLVLTSMQTIENFRYRCADDRVILCDSLHPSLAHIKPGEDLFMLVIGEYHPDLAAFDAGIKTTIENQTDYFPFRKTNARIRNDLVFFSSLHWFAFQGVDHTLSLNKNDGIPRVTWGKIVLADQSEWLPFNIQVNHRFVDGIHVHYLLEEMRKLRGRVLGC